MFIRNAVILIIYILLNINLIISFSIPFYSSKNLSNSTTPLQILDSLKNNIKYSFIEIDESSQKLPIIFTSHDASLKIMKNDCPIKTNYELNLFKNAKIIYEENNDKYFYVFMYNKSS